MTAKVRKQIYLDQSQDKRLKQLASSSGVSEAEVIRQALVQLRDRAAAKARAKSLTC